MIRAAALSALIFAYTVFFPAPADAYLLPLIGAGPAIMAVGFGIAMAALSALYLIFYSIYRAMRRGLGKASDGDEDEDDAPDDTRPPS